VVCWTKYKIRTRERKEIAQVTEQVGSEQWALTQDSWLPTQNSAINFVDSALLRTDALNNLP
jgi:hypothetical protein